jgi:hypothetical protein
MQSLGIYVQEIQQNQTSAVNNHFNRPRMNFLFVLHLTEIKHKN